MAFKMCNSKVCVSNTDSNLKAVISNTYEESFILAALNLNELTKIINIIQ